MSAPDTHARDFALGQLRRRLLRSSWAFVLIGAGFAYKRAFGFKADGTDLFLIIALLAVLGWALYGAFVGAPDDEQQWRLAVAELRWGDALGLLPRLARVFPEAHLPLIRAQALAGLGRGREAEAAAQSVDKNLLATWEYWTLLARVREAGGDAPGRRVALEAALPHAPNPRDVLFELAELALVEDQDAPTAAHYLHRVHERAMPAPTAAKRLALEGMLAFEQGHLVEAEQHLEEALSAAEAERLKSPELLDTIPKVHAYLAMLTAQRGRKGEAQVHMKATLPELRRRRQRTLMQRVQAVLRG